MKAHVCFLTAYSAGPAHLRLPPPQPNSIDSTMGSLKDTVYKHIDNEPDIETYMKMHALVELKSKRSPTEEKEMTEEENRKEREEEAARQQTISDKEDARASTSKSEARKRRKSYESFNNNDRKKSDSPKVEIIANRFDDKAGVLNNNAPVSSVAEIFGDSNMNGKNGGGGGGGMDSKKQHAKLSAIEKLDMNLKKNNHRSGSPTSGISANGSVASESRGNRNPRGTSGKSSTPQGRLPPPEKSVPTPVKSVFPQGPSINDPDSKGLLEEAMRAANNARMSERKERGNSMHSKKSVDSRKAR